MLPESRRDFPNFRPLLVVPYSPRKQSFSGCGKDLYAIVVGIRHVDAPLGADGDAGRMIELAGTVACPAPVSQRFHRGGKLFDAVEIVLGGKDVACFIEGQIAYHRRIPGMEFAVTWRQLDHLPMLRRQLLSHLQEVRVDYRCVEIAVRVECYAENVVKVSNRSQELTFRRKGAYIAGVIRDIDRAVSIDGDGRDSPGGGMPDGCVAGNYLVAMYRE